MADSELSFPDLNVLVVDDDDFVRETLISVLEDLGIFPDAANSVDDALPFFEEDSYDLVITDHIMPGGGGEKLAKSIRSLPSGKDCIIFLVTGGVDGEDLLKLGDNNQHTAPLFNDILAKPFRSKTLGDLILKHFSHRIEKVS